MCNPQTIFQKQSAYRTGEEVGAQRGYDRVAAGIGNDIRVVKWRGKREVESIGLGLWQTCA